MSGKELSMTNYLTGMAIGGNPETMLKIDNFRKATPPLEKF